MARPLRRDMAGALVFGAMALGCLPQAEAAQKAADASAVIYRTTDKRTADIGAGTRAIRVLVHYSRTKFFVASDRPALRKIAGIDSMVRR